jgi:enediyne biosynthesis protein E4
MSSLPLGVLVLAVATLQLPAARAPLFRERAAELGLKFEHVNGAAGRYHLPEIMGAGGAFLDYDSDGDLDVLLIQGRALEPPAAAAAPPPSPRLFRNDLDEVRGTASLRFTDVTERAGFATGDYGMGVAAGDYDNDGDPDLYLTNYGANRLYRNDGGGQFTDVTRAAGAHLDDPRWSTSASFSDYDADGDLDLFVVNYVDFMVAGSKVCSDPAGARDYCGPLQFRPVPDRLFRNDGNGTFSDVSEPSGIARAYGSGLGVASADFNGDGRLDFYVANDGMANQLWINQGKGAFVDDALLAGVAFNMDGQPEGSMGLAIGDPDSDGDPDIFITNINGETHAFYENLGRGRFEDRRLTTGLAALTRAYTGFGTNWFDYDNDGILDLFIANGAVTIIEVLRGDPFPFRQRNLLLHNAGGGYFQDASHEGGSAFEPAFVGRGAAFGDVDNDGDVDVLVTNNAGPVRLLLNETGALRHWLQVRLHGVEDNRQGLGARVGVQRDDGTTVWRHARTDGSYLSASDPRVHFGLASTRAVRAILVEWPRGGREVWRGVEVNRPLTLRQGTGSRTPGQLRLARE